MRRTLIALVELSAMMCACLICAFWLELASAPRLLDAYSNVDSMVVFTGDRSRLEAGARIIQQGYQGPVLISGAEPGATAERLLFGLGLSAEQLARVAVDDKARNTRENVEQTGRWASNLHYRRLLLVTSTYHTPRALLLLRLHQPWLDVAVHPVSPGSDFTLIPTELLKYWSVRIGLGTA